MGGYARLAQHPPSQRALQPQQHIAEGALARTARRHDGEPLPSGQWQIQPLEQGLLPVTHGEPLPPEQPVAGRGMHGLGPGRRLCRQQGAAVGMGRCLQHLLGGPLLHYLTPLDHQHPAPQRPCQGEIMGDGQQVTPLGQITEQQFLQPETGPAVEPLGGLVGDEQTGLPQGGGGKGGALGHAPGELVREVALPPGEPEPRQGVPRPRARLLASRQPALLHLGQQPHGGVQRQHRLLGQHGQLPPPEGAQGLGVRQAVAPAAHHHLTPAAQGSGQGPHQGVGQQGFARAALPYQGQSTAGEQGEIQRLQQGLLAVIHLQALDMNGRHGVTPCGDGV